MKHTPGPWQIDEIQTEDWKINISAGNRIIACAFHLTDDPVIPDEECLANAQLIFLAPQMFEVLKDLCYRTFRNMPKDDTLNA